MSVTSTLNPTQDQDVKSASVLVYSLSRLTHTEYMDVINLLLLRAHITRITFYYGINKLCKALPYLGVFIPHYP